MLMKENQEVNIEVIEVELEEEEEEEKEIEEVSTIILMNFLKWNKNINDLVYYLMFNSFSFI